jgi:hypothetical protein
MFSHSNTLLSSVVDFRAINGVILSAYVGALVQLGLALWSVGDCIQTFFQAETRYDIFSGRSQDVVTSIYDGELMYIFTTSAYIYVGGGFESPSPEASIVRIWAF